jgi:hypothetical protein
MGVSTAVPDRQCDLVMKGGITSGVIYPSALAEIGKSYQFRGVGGASAGAIGAAMGAAAEFGRSTGGFARLDALPSQLGDGRLAGLFQPQPGTRELLRLMLVVAGSDRPGPPRTGANRVLAVIRALVTAFPVASLLGALPGIVAIVLGLVMGGWAALLVAVLGAIVALLGCAVALALRLKAKLTVDVPGNLFGICRGLGTADAPGFTDWLSDRIDEVAGLDDTARPLRFGHLWTGSTELTYVHTKDRRIDLRMVSTCLSQGRPYELPWAARNFFYDPATWATLFPAPVMRALEKAPPPAQPEGSSASQRATWLWEDEVAAAYDPPLRRLPDSQHLPVVVATRLSLSFPLLISAIPLYAIDIGSTQTQQAIAARRKAIHDGTRLPTSGLEFCKLWFTDGGLCSNFPLHLFDAALTSRPTFAINLGAFEPGHSPSENQRENIELATTNRSGLLPPHTPIPESGFGAVAGFGSAALNTARNWQDGSYLDQPGYRDRIVRVLQTRTEGGLNLFMDGPTIDGLAARGKAAAETLVEQFTEPRYPERDAWATGWDNHRWVRYRAFLACLPDWLSSYARGRAVLCTDLDHPPSYTLSPSARALAADLTAALDEAAAVCAKATPAALAALTGTPSPQASIRRIPRI